jgi:hypothetical protein
VNNNIPNIYTGTWSGAFVAPEAQGTGTISLTVTPGGLLTCTMVGSGGLDGSFTCTMLGDGHFSSTKVSSANQNFTSIFGAVALTSTGMSGNFDYQWIKQNYIGTFTATLSSGVSSGSTGSTSGSTGSGTATAGATLLKN